MWKVAVGSWVLTIFFAAVATAAPQPGQFVVTWPMVAFSVTGLFAIGAAWADNRKRHEVTDKRILRIERKLGIKD